MPQVTAGTVQRGVTVLNRTLMHLAVLLHVTPVSDAAIQGVPGGMCQTSGECSLC